MEKIVSSVLSHWHHPFEGLHESPQAFYCALEDALSRRQIPGAVVSRVEFHEGSILTAKREYLRVERERLLFDLCAAPFGNGFFVSWWVGMARSPWAMVTTLGILLLAASILILLVGKFGAIVGGLLTALIVLSVLWFLGTLIRDGSLKVDFSLSELPLFGPLYDKIFKPDTYYRVDTMYMFMEFVSGAVMEVIDRMTSEKGYRSLTEQERKPILKDLFKR